MALSQNREPLIWLVSFLFPFENKKHAKGGSLKQDTPMWKEISRAVANTFSRLLRHLVGTGRSSASRVSAVVYGCFVASGCRIHPIPLFTETSLSPAGASYTFVFNVAALYPHEAGATFRAGFSLPPGPQDLTQLEVQRGL